MYIFQIYVFCITKYYITTFPIRVFLSFEKKFTNETNKLKLDLAHRELEYLNKAKLTYENPEYKIQIVSTSFSFSYSHILYII